MSKSAKSTGEMFDEMYRAGKEIAFREAELAALTTYTDRTRGKIAREIADKISKMAESVKSERKS